MKVHTRCLIAIVLVGAPSVVAQSTAPQIGAVTRSHVERFSTPQMRAEQTEVEASAKLAANPRDAGALNARALARMRLNRYQESYEDLRQVVTLEPTNSEYQANLGYVLWKLGRPAEAIAAERAAIKLDDKNYTAHYQLGRFLLRLGEQKELTEAARQLRRALEIDPRQYETRFELVAAYRALGNTELALGQYQLLQDARPLDPRVTYIGALLSADRGDMKTAISGFQEALRRDSSLVGAWQDLGLAYIKLNRWSEAAETFAELTKLQPASADAAYFYALALFNSGQSTAAEKEARRSLRLNAGDASSLTLLGIVLAARGDANNEASEALAQAVALTPASFDANFYLGRVAYTLKDYATAVQSLRAALKLNPQHAEARFFLGTALEAAGDSQAALVEYQKLIEIDPKSAMGQIGLGALLVKQGRTDEAISALKRATSLEAKSFEAHWALGRALNLAERFTDAVESLQTAVALAPDRPDAHYQLGLALKRLGRAAEANREFAIVDRLNTEFRTNRPAKQ
ncbi:MAG TPA: tetratricopeptide repeat protein [Pyrinomonadaceae bacterium]|nr:tetratricopeptide repeat protein [Pyrinomonadaceae bacterium]